MNVCTVLSGVALAVNCVFFFIYPDYEFVWLFSLVLTVLCAVFYGKVLARCATTVEDNNM